MYECKEKDWKLFRKRLPVWQSNYMEKLFVKYEKIFDSDLDAGERFWTVFERMKKDSRKTLASAWYVSKWKPGTSTTYIRLHRH